MSINKGHTPLPNSFIANINKLKLTHREYRLIMTIGTEIYRFPEGRENLSKELSTRYLESLTNIKQNHISKMLNRFHLRGYINYIKSHVKGQGSIIILTLDTTTGSNNSDTAIVSNDTNLDTTTVSKDIKSDTATVSNQKSISKKDHQESDPTDSITNITKKEETPERNNIENSPDCSYFIKERYTSSKESNSNTPDINLLSPAGTTDKGEFSALGNILSDIKPASTATSPAPAEHTPGTSGFSISPEVIAEGHKVLSSKGFNKEQVQAITQTITDRIRKYNPIRPDRYFLTSVNNEQVKNVSPLNQTAHSAFNNSAPAQCAAPSVEKTRRYVNEFWKEEKDSITTEEILTTLTKTCPDKLNTVITNVTNDEKIQRGLSFMVEGEAKKLALGSIILAEFKKTYPGIVV